MLAAGRLNRPGGGGVHPSSPSRPSGTERACHPALCFARRTCGPDDLSPREIPPSPSPSRPSETGRDCHPALRLRAGRSGLTICHWQIIRAALTPRQARSAPARQPRPCDIPGPTAPSALRLRSGPEGTGVLPLAARRACLRKQRGEAQESGGMPTRPSPFLPRLAQARRDATACPWQARSAPARQPRPCDAPGPTAPSALRLRSGPEGTGVLPLAARRACLRKQRGRPSAQLSMA
jgi:hypothetical protein